MVKLSKEEAVKKIDLRKNQVVSLAKQNPALAGLKARVALVLDFSGSMSHNFADGTVQSIIERIIPLALCFDDNGELDFWIFENGYTRLDGITLNNFYGLAERVMEKYSMGGTSYAPVMKDVAKKYITEEPENMPNYVIFITDGDNSDKSAAEETVCTTARYPIFWQFVGIPSNSRVTFPFLEKLDDMEGRYVDNANFFSVSDINSMSDEDLYDKLLDEFPSWLKDAKVQEMLKDVSALPPLSSALKKSGGLFGKLFG